MGLTKGPQGIISSATAEYTVAAKIAIEPAFAWWVPYTLKKRNRIISKVKSNYWLRTLKFWDSDT